MKNPQALARKPSLWDACLAIEWMCHFQMKLGIKERPSCVRKVEVSGSLPFMRTGGKSGLCLREMTTCAFFLS